ncbi:hypothetical protein G4X40_20235 [Rhodococcus sp. D2-41]|uniref:hypothetical protein n=1 Tax=Speluncibacter jeojiensis TaxID=2710754 RepID=UPI00240F729E|nr:hypothetical protein [Rhodococcus sp. D2-41]MDG3012472.1 hypothetical protein [Rhodococcus sp. D2-41]
MTPAETIARIDTLIRQAQAGFDPHGYRMHRKDIPHLIDRLRDQRATITRGEHG